jgi:nitroimidazol reductase NimA-like FMN-containing flavoprotein (pyridoxamine 5'-phosphate oxidase superfamily)
MPSAAAIDLLWNSTQGRLGCIANGRPYVVPVNYCFDGQNILIHSHPGLEIEELTGAGEEW